MSNKNDSNSNETTSNNRRKQRRKRKNTKGRLDQLCQIYTGRILWFNGREGRVDVSTIRCVEPRSGKASACDLEISEVKVAANDVVAAKRGGDGQHKLYKNDRVQFYLKADTNIHRTASKNDNDTVFNASLVSAVDHADRRRR